MTSLLPGGVFNSVIELSFCCSGLTHLQFFECGLFVLHLPELAPDSGLDDSKFTSDGIRHLQLLFIGKTITPTTTKQIGSLACYLIRGLVVEPPPLASCRTGSIPPRP